MGSRLTIMATYFAHSINQIDKDGVNIGDCLTAVLANQADKAAILKAIRDNLILMNNMRDEKVAAAQALVTAAEAERDALGTKPEAQAILKQKRIDEATAKIQAAEAELAELTKAEAEIVAEK